VVASIKRASLPTVDAEMAFAVAGMFFGIGQVHGRDPDAFRWLFSSVGAGGKQVPNALAVGCAGRYWSSLRCAWIMRFRASVRNRTLDGISILRAIAAEQQQSCRCAPVRSAIMPNENVRRGHDVVIKYPDVVNLYGCTIGEGAPKRKYDWP
jgi:hypothetical protein